MLHWLLILLRYAVLMALITVIIVVLCYFAINWSTRSAIYSDINKVPHRHVGLVLGTNKYLQRGGINQFYQSRIDTAARLYHAGKVDYLIVSGDNRSNNYNEPKQMTKDLVKAGVPASRIQPDYAGLRTLDSVLRMDKIFGHRNYLIISQRFHNQRALFLADAKGQQPIAFNAPDPTTQGMKKVISREYLARIKAILDLIVNTQARHYGEPINFPPD
ncbi:MAG: hypothetical protein CSA44_00530 [Gammaproteobacteria bacterium]|nr:MAG: hypothetical protein CSA44_00530 [Gammaproteobacteria bacterium]